MKEHIEKGAFLERVEQFFPAEHMPLLRKLVLTQPAEDVVEVVRCKDCKHWKPMDDGISWNNRGRTDGQCEMLWQIHNAERHLTNDEHFCGYGERKEQNDIH